MSVRSPAVIVLAAALVAAASTMIATKGHAGDVATQKQIAPAGTFEVAVRKLTLRRRSDRPLPTTVWYPVAERRRFPLVLFSHGLGGTPEQSPAITTRWAAAGFVVVAPAYPHTKRDAKRFDRADVKHQPADAAYVLGEVMKLDTTTGDPFEGRLDTSRACATGYSAGGFTTSGMFVAGRDTRLRCGIVIAAGRIDGGFTGPAAPVLFVHGDRDKVVTYARGRAAYDGLRWPKAFLTLYGQGHGEYMTADRPGYSQTLNTTTDFLRWMLYGDPDAKRRLTDDAVLEDVSSFSLQL